MDSGVNINHGEFVTRAKLLYGVADDHGHGTHCSGTVGGATYGIARQSTIQSVKICNQHGSCTKSAFVLGKFSDVFISSNN